MTLQLRFICMNPSHPLTPPSFTSFVFTNSYNRLFKQLSIGSKSFSDRWDLHFWASTKRFHIPYGCSVCEGRRNLFEMNFEGWSASFDWSTCSERAHWEQIRTGRIVLLSAWRWRVFQRNCRALGEAFDEAFDEAFNEAFNEVFDEAFDEAFDERAFDDEAFEEAFEEAFNDKACEEAFDEEAFSSVLKNMISRRFNCSFIASDLNEWI